MLELVTSVIDTMTGKSIGGVTTKKSDAGCQEVTCYRYRGVDDTGLNALIMQQDVPG